MGNWRKEYKMVLKELYKEDYFYLESYLEQFIEAQIEKAKEERIGEALRIIDAFIEEASTWELLKLKLLSKLKE